MSDPKSPEQAKRPAWAQNMDDAEWNKFYSSKQDGSSKNNAANAATNNTGSNIQEEIISASAKSMENKDNFDLESGKSTVSNKGVDIPSREEIEAVIVKTNKPEPSGPSTHFDKSATASGKVDLPEEKKSKYSFTAKEEKTQPTTTPRHTGRPGQVAGAPERPVRGYGVLTLLPLLTLTILLTIHTASFIYTQSGQLLLENPQQITAAKALNFPDNFFIPTVSNETIKEISPGQYWFLGAVFKLSPFSDSVNLHIAAAIAALLMLWSAYSLCKAAIPKNKGVAFSTGLILLSSVIFLGGAWFFSPEMLAIALATLAQALLLKGLKRPSGAYLYFVPGMILGALAILTDGLLIALLLFIPIVFYLVVTADVRRFSSADFIAGLVVLIVALTAWAGGATFFLGWGKVSGYIFPLNAVLAGDPVVFSINEMILYGCVLLLPWLFLPVLLLDRIIVKIPGIGKSVKTEKGQGTLFVIIALLTGFAVLAIDGVSHPALGLAVLPPLAILASRAVLYMSRSRARIFILLTALIFAALTALLALKAGGFGTTLLPWSLDLWAIIPLIGAAVFCTLFLARAAQVSAGKALLLVYAICWLFIAQVFLFAGMPASAKHLKFSDIETAIAEKTSKADWTVAYLNTPAWAADYDTASHKKVSTWKEIQDIAKSAPVLAVIPESEWEELDKEQYPFKKLESQILVLTSYVLVQSASSGQPLTDTPGQEHEDTAPVELESILPPTNATTEETGEVEVTEEQAPAGLNTRNATPETMEQPETQNHEQADVQNAASIIEAATGGNNTQQDEAQASIKPLGQAGQNSTSYPEPAVEAEKPEPAITQEEVISTTYVPKAMRQIDLVYGKISGMPEMTIVVRYKEIKQVN